MLTVYGASESGEVALPDSFPDDAILGSFQGVERYVDEFPGEDVVNVCTQYLCFLEQVVAECEANHEL